MQVETIAEQLFFTTARIEALLDGGLVSIGTGFIYEVQTDKGIGHLLVTNRHVLAGAKSIIIQMVRSVGDSPLLGEAAQIRLDDFGPEAWVGHPDEAIDVAVMTFAPRYDDMAAAGIPPFFRAIPSGLMVSPQLEGELDAIEDVTFVGYPSGLFDTHNFLPIARRGTTATPISVDYQGKPTFLIDAAVFPGSSGSPVFLVDRGMYRARGGGLVVGGDRFACLGLVAAVHIRDVAGDIFEIETKLAVTVEQPIGLGIVYKARTINECVDRLLSMLGAQRVTVEPTGPTGETTAADDDVAPEIRVDEQS